MRLGGRRMQPDCSGDGRNGGGRNALRCGVRGFVNMTPGSGVVTILMLPKPIAGMAARAGRSPLTENDSVHPDNVVSLGSRPRNVVREGSF